MSSEEEQTQWIPLAKLAAVMSFLKLSGKPNEAKYISFAVIAVLRFGPRDRTALLLTAGLDGDEGSFCQNKETMNSIKF